MASLQASGIAASVRPSWQAVRVGPWPWLGILALAALTLPLREGAPWLLELPDDLRIPLVAWLDAGARWIVAATGGAFRAIAAVLTGPLAGLRLVLTNTPWPVGVTLVCLLAWLAGGRRLALLALAALLYIVAVGYWDESMQTLALVLMVVPVSVGLGLAVGIVAFRWPRSRFAIDPILDLLQAIPTFAYLIPALLLFGFSPIVGIAAAIAYAFPPMARNVLSGLLRVPQEVVEAGVMVGCTRRQHLALVRLPAAKPSLLIGINQTVMAALSMVVIAALIGGVHDIGYEVLRTLRKGQFGQSLLAGAVITLLAVLADRITAAFARRQPGLDWRWRRVAWGIALAVGAAVLHWAVPVLEQVTEQGLIPSPKLLDDAVTWFTAEFFPVADAIKNVALFYLLLPLRIGLEHALRPPLWPFELTDAVRLAYAALVLAAAAAAFRLWRWKAVVAVGCAGTVYYFGTTGLPWPVTVAAVVLLAGQAGGWRLAAGAAAAMAFIVLTGLWQTSMVSVQLCTAAIVLCLAVGIPLGIWGADSRRAWSVLEPICDTLQTIPLFVFLIPVMMVFLLGEFSAVIAIVMYAIVPAIRYTRHGLCNLPAEVVEAGRASGATRWQLLRYVRLPLAMPEILLGLNQVIVMALAMLIVTALLGTKDLGQQIYAALSRSSIGSGLVAGFAIALIAILADRITQAASRRMKASLGLA